MEEVVKYRGSHPLSTIAILIVWLGALFVWASFPQLFALPEIAIKFLLGLLGFSIFAFFFASSLTKEVRTMEIRENILTVDYWFAKRRKIDLGQVKNVFLLRPDKKDFLTNLGGMNKLHVLVIDSDDGKRFVFPFNNESGWHFAEEVDGRFDSLRNERADNP